MKGLADLSRGGRSTLAAAWPDLSESVRRRVTRQLGKTAQERVELNFGRALRVALDDSSAVVRQLAVAGLWEDDSSDLRDRLARMTVEDPSSDVRAEAARGLGRFARQIAAGELNDEVGQALYDLLVRLAGDAGQPEEVRRRALESVGAFGGDDVSGLIDAAYASDDHGLRLSAVVAMGRSTDATWLETLVEELESEDADLREEAARALGEIGDARVVHELSTAATDEMAEVRRAAIAALGQIGGSAAAKALQGLEQEEEGEERAAVAEAIAEARGEVIPF